MDDLHHMDDELRSIHLDAILAPRLQPLRLEQMWQRASDWNSPARAPPPIRPASPPRKIRIYPLPKPLPAEVGVSPLGEILASGDLLPLVLRYFDQPRELALLCRVSKGFERICRKKLYESIWIRPWEEGCHFKLILLFNTLAKHPDLCRLIKQLDVRFFPLATRGGERYDLDDHVEKALAEMTNLKSLIWTRDKSLTPQIFETMAELSKLRSLEITGHSHRYYDPKLLGTMPKLEDLRIMMPDYLIKNSLVKIVKDLDERPQGGLTGLGLICRSSPLIDDAILKAMATSFRGLKRLHLWGCTRVTKSGVFDVLHEAQEIQELSLDALPHSGMLDMSAQPTLSSLHTYSLSIFVPNRIPLLLTLEDLPLVPPTPILKSLHITLSGSRAHLPAGGIQHLLNQFDPIRIRSLSLLNLVVAPPQLTELLNSCYNLKKLFISVNGRNTLLDCPELKVSKLEVFHVTCPETWGPNADDLAMLVRDMENIREVGVGNRVYEVTRGEGGIVELDRWSKTWTPTYFQIWRG